MSTTLEDLGWDAAFQAEFDRLSRPDLEPARVVRLSRGFCRVRTADGEQLARRAGRLISAPESAPDPAIGDWVAIEHRADESRAIVRALFSRRSKFARKAAGKATEGQVIACNIDTIFVVTGLDQDFHVRRLERYIALAQESGADPVIVLNKMDLCGEVVTRIDEAKRCAPGVPVVAISALDAASLEQLRPWMRHGKTIALLGSSGTGKSTLVNAFLRSDRMKVGETRERDGKGRHTTTHRELVVLPNGAMVIDTPGIRELAMWGDKQSLLEAFSDLQALTSRCRFSDCRHDTEPDCEVRRALETGQLAQARYQSFRKLLEEFEELERRQTESRQRSGSGAARSFKKKGS